MALYGSPLEGSVTRLETFAACAYAQFLTYGLKLVRRKEFEFAALDMGNVPVCKRSGDSGFFHG